MVWGTELIQFLEEQNEFILPQDEFILFFKSSQCKIASAARNKLIHPILQIVLVQNSFRDKELYQFCPPKQKRRPFAFSTLLSTLLKMSLFPLSWLGEGRGTPGRRWTSLRGSFSSSSPNISSQYFAIYSTITQSDQHTPHWAKYKLKLRIETEPVTDVFKLVFI